MQIIIYDSKNKFESHFKNILNGNNIRFVKHKSLHNYIVI